MAYAEEDGTLVFDTVSRYEAIQLERRFSKEDAGCLLDNEAALEMRELNRSYQESATVPTFILLNRFLVQDGIAITYFNPLWDGTDQMADLTYKAIAYTQEEEYQNQRLTQEEIDYWKEERAEIDTPYTLGYAKGYSGILSMAQWLNLMVLPFVFVCLCGSFSDDHVYKTWPILTSSKHGRKSLALARLVAGETLAGGALLLLFAVTAAIQFFVHGAQGAGVPIQLLEVENLRPGFGETRLCASSRVMTAGQGVLVTVGVSLLILLFAGALAMLLSKLFRRAIPALALPLVHRTIAGYRFRFGAIFPLAVSAKSFFWMSGWFPWAAYSWRASPCRLGSMACWPSSAWSGASGCTDGTWWNRNEVVI